MQMALIEHNGQRRTLLVHEPESGRVVIKGPVDDLWRSLDRALREPCLVEKVDRGAVLARRKVLPQDERYLRVLVGGVVRAPYRIADVRTVSEVGRLDAVAERLARQLLPGR
jgi:hypothetical protein